MKMETLLSLKLSKKVKPVLEVLEDEEGADDDDLDDEEAEMTKSKKTIQMMTKINKTVIINRMILNKNKEYHEK
jgi:hypothetical protein